MSHRGAVLAGRWPPLAEWPILIAELFSSPHPSSARVLRVVYFDSARIQYSGIVPANKKMCESKKKTKGADLELWTLRTTLKPGTSPGRTWCPRHSIPPHGVSRCQGKSARCIYAAYKKPAVTCACKQTACALQRTTATRVIHNVHAVPSPGIRGQHCCACDPTQIGLVSASGHESERPRERTTLPQCSTVDAACSGRVVNGRAPVAATVIASCLSGVDHTIAFMLGRL